ncbi:MAG: small ribosomal subunit biogenesis GTPase RsgA [Endozoicomonas sp. (ex Botrylloides leachii)]|nr:small ribosomal subunit biogenesis GTPase RsgA [Endozoicomonas sp. (ex Botrylloides leachii)]
MTKRKLTRRQSWRIQKIQEERTARLNKRESAVKHQLNNNHLGPEQAGLVVEHYGAQTDIEPINQPGNIWRCHLRSNLPPLVTGDKVIWRATTTNEKKGVIVALDKRSSLLSRPDARGQLKPVAANIDYIIVVIAPLPTPYAHLIDRYLVAAETVNIEPVILLNKIDLLSNQQERQRLERLLAIYKCIGYKVLNASTFTESGLAPLQALLNEHTSVFVGQSGVGKSSLMNALLPSTNMRVGALSEATGKGNHTTTSAKLCHFPTGGALIDSPGIREFNLWHMMPDDIIDGFREFRPFIGHCRFRDCKHDKEPGCAIEQALKDGKILPSRLDSYWKIITSLGSK